jgi:protein-disulfide isomerase
MASRKEQKDAARQRRLAEEQAAAQKRQRTRRVQLLGGVIAAAIVVVVVLVIVSSGGGGNSSPVKVSDPGKVKGVAAQVSSLLKGIPQSGNTLGNPKAKVTYTEYGDLECPICKEFSEGAEKQLIENEVRKGEVKLVYKSFPTATGDLGDASTIFPLQQSAAYAAGQQDKAWNYILLFYRLQQQEGTPYVNTAFLTKIASSIPGLNVAQWNTQRNNPKYTGEVVEDEKAGQTAGVNATPTLIASSAKSQTKPTAGAISYSDVQQMIKSVS